MNQIAVFLGPPGSGKGTQAQKLKKEFNFFHFSTGDMLRDHIRNAPESDPIRQIVSQGKLVDDATIMAFVGQENARRKFFEQNVILDGFPRTVEQAKMLETELEKIGKKIDKVILFQIELQTLIDRITTRLICPACGAIFSSKQASLEVGSNCPACMATHKEVRLVQRPDDSAEKVRSRYEIFEKETAPLITFYKDKLTKINAAYPPHQVFEELCSAILPPSGKKPLT